MLHSQNLVPNPSFENYTVCPYDYYMLPINWYTCSNDPDYFNACDSTNDFGVPTNGFGYQQAADGRAYCGFFSISFTSIPYAKEYLGCHLLSPLQIGHKYFISFKISHAELYEISSNNIGLLFSTQSYQDYQPYDNIWNIPTINFAHIVDANIIDDSVNWTTIKGSIIADSAYQYILIGDFFDSAHTDTIIHGHNFFLQRAYYYLDDVCVSEDSLTCNSPDTISEILKSQEIIDVFPNPASDFIQYTIGNPYKDCTVNILNPEGSIIYNCKNTFPENKISLTGIATGLYFMRFAYNDKTVVKKLVIIK